MYVLILDEYECCTQGSKYSIHVYVHIIKAQMFQNIYSTTNLVSELLAFVKQTSWSQRMTNKTSTEQINTSKF